MLVVVEGRPVLVGLQRQRIEGGGEGNATADVGKVGVAGRIAALSYLGGLLRRAELLCAGHPKTAS